MLLEAMCLLGMVQRTLDLADVKATPEKYFNYGNEPKKTDTERIDTLEATTDDIILMMADLIGGEA